MTNAILVVNQILMIMTNAIYILKHIKGIDVNGFIVITNNFEKSLKESEFNIKNINKLVKLRRYIRSLTKSKVLIDEHLMLKDISEKYHYYNQYDEEENMGKYSHVLDDKDKQKCNQFTINLHYNNRKDNFYIISYTYDDNVNSY